MYAQQPSHKTMMDTLSRRMEAEPFYKLLVVREITFSQLFQPWILHGLDQCSEFPVHLFNVFGADRKIVAFYVFALVRLADPFHIELVGTLKYRHISVYNT